MNLMGYFTRHLHTFEMRKIPYYFSRIPLYRRVHKFLSRTNGLRNEGIKYGTINGGEEVYIYNTEDIELPMHMCKSQTTFPLEEIELFLRLARQKMGLRGEAISIFLDIGANIGTTSIYVNKHHHLRIIAFEPNEDNYRCLTANMALNEVKDFVAERYGVSDSEGSKMMEINHENHGNNHIVNGENEDGDYERISSIRLDDYLIDKGIDFSAISYIWMDIEGHEPYAIAGMMKLLLNHRIPMFMEFWPERYSDDEFRYLHGNLSKAYDKFMAYDNDLRLIADSSINKLEKLYQRKSGYRGNIFLY